MVFMENEGQNKRFSQAHVVTISIFTLVVTKFRRCEDRFVQIGTDELIGNIHMCLKMQLSLSLLIRVNNQHKHYLEN